MLKYGASRNRSLYNLTFENDDESLKNDILDTLVHTVVVLGHPGLA